MSKSVAYIAKEWAGIIRECCEEVIFDLWPSLNCNSLKAIRLQTLFREFLLANADEYIMHAEGIPKEEMAYVKREMQPLLIEELIPGCWSEIEQAEFAMFLLRCIEEPDAFHELLMEAMPWCPPELSDYWCRQGDKNKEKALSHMRNTAELFYRARNHTYGPTTFPAGYPYMDEFEYIDHCIAGDDD